MLKGLAQLTRNSAWFVAGLLSTGRTGFRLRPANQVSPADAGFVGEGSDPYFFLEPEKGRLPHGRGVLMFALSADDGGPVNPKLYVDTGAGFNEEEAVQLGTSRDGRCCARVSLPPGVRAMRLDPLDRACRFQLSDVHFVKPNSPRSVVRQAWRQLRRNPLGLLRHLGLAARFAASDRLKEHFSALAAADPDPCGGGLAFTPEAARDPYEAWLAVNRMTPARLEALRTALAALAARPRFSVLMPVYDPPEQLLDEAIASVCGQLYADWELIVVDDASSEAHVRTTLERWQQRDARIRVSRRAENGGISRATNDAAARAAGRWLVCLDHDDLLAPEALATLALHIDAHPQHELVYSDDDKVDPSGRRFAPQFKPDWSPELLLSFSYTSHVKCIAADLWRRVGGFRVGFEGSQDYDFMLRASEQARGVGHVPQMLYHWRASPRSTAAGARNKPASIEAGRRAVEEAFRRRGAACRVERPAWAVEADCGVYAPVFPDTGPRVAIIVPTRNQRQLLQRCLESLERTTYRNRRLIVVDNESDEPESLAYLRSLRCEVWRIPNPAGGFSFAHLNNEAARRVDDCELLLFLNNDVEVREPRWLSQMVGWSQLPGVGAVGARLLYADGRVQHSGIVHGYYHGLAGPAFKLAPSWDKGYLSFAGVTRNYLAVTAACLLTPRQVFQDFGGFDADRFAVAYNDVDYGYRLAAKGLRSVCCVEAELLHHEGQSRGFRDHPRELAAFRAAYRGLRDPYYNPNLGLEHERFPIRPRVLPVAAAPAVRAVLVSHNLNWEGAPNSLLEFACGLKRRGCLDPVVWSPADGPMRKAWEDAGIPVSIVEPPPCGSSEQDYVSGLERFAARVRAEGAAVVYGNTLQAFWAIDGARRAGLPAVWNVRESEPWQTYFDYLPAAIAARALGALSYPYRVVFVADTTRDAWAELDTRLNFTVIRNGLDLERLRRRGGRDRAAARRRLGLAEGETAFLLLGTVCARKGQHDLVRAFGALPAAIAARSKCWIVGDRPSPYSREMHALLAALPAERSRRVSVVPETGEIGDFWAGADVFVCTSRLESYPRVVLEAMALGLPVLATPCFGVTEQVRPDVNGRFYPAGDHAALAGAMSALAADADLRRLWAANSPQVLAGLTSYEEMLDAYAAVFREAALSHPPMAAGN